jgi:hypothetical protein
MLPFTQEKARIFRITHVDNIPWALRHGLRCRSSPVYDPNYRNIGNPDLIEKRTKRVVPIAPGGTLSDYVPFYFTSRSPMLLNIKSGWKGLPRVPMRDIVVIVASLHRLAERGVRFVFSDRHAYLVTAQFSSDLRDLDRIDWGILQRSDFRYDDNDPGKMDRYQAEALVHDYLPIGALAGIICYDEKQAGHVQALIADAGHATKVAVNTAYYF